MEEDKKNIFEDCESVSDAVEESENETFKEKGQDKSDPVDVDIKVNTGEKDADVYSEEGREELTENDEMSAEEEGFVEGAEGQDEKGVHGNCPTCGKTLGDREDGIVEREINGEKVFFCCDECAKEYESKVPPDKRGE